MNNNSNILKETNNEPQIEREDIEQDTSLEINNIRRNPSRHR